MNHLCGDSVQGHVISLAEWIALSAFLENQQAAEARRESRLAFIERAAIIALHLVDMLLENQGHGISCDTDESCIRCGLQAKDIVLENFAVEIGADYDIEDLKKSPELLFAALESVTDVKIPDSLRRNYAVKDVQTLPEILQKLGLVLYQLFSRGKIAPSSIEKEESIVYTNKLRTREGFDDGTEDEDQPGAKNGRQQRSIGDTCKSFRRVQISVLEDSLSELCVPASISILVKDLIERGDDDEYAFQSLEDVSAELRQIAVQPNAFLYYGEDTSQKGVLDFEGNIVGRAEEMSCLLEAAARIEMAGDDPSHPHSLVLIGGGAGLGKSYLVENVCDSLTESGWIYLSCKFDRLMAKPLSTIASAFEKFFQHVASSVNWGRDIGAILSSVQDNLSASGIVVLSELIPSFCTLYPVLFASIVRDDDFDSSEEDRISSEDEHLNDSTMDNDIIASAETLKNRLHYLFRKLVHAIARPEHPLFLCVDDLQWVDESGIQLLSSLLTDSDYLINNNGDSQRLLVFGTYRDDEVDEGHILSNYLNKFNSSASVSVRNIHLVAITKTDANVLVSEAIRLPVRQTRVLTDAVYAKTLGNPLYLQLFMKSLVDEKLLSYSLVEKRWIWNIEAVRATSIDDNVAELLTRKLRRLPDDCQKALKIASCFGLQVEESSLRILLASNKRLIPCLERARQEGILEWDGLRFAHDMIQQAAYDMMSPEERGERHYTIGFQLVAHISSTKESHHFHPITFAAADQINIAKSLTATEGFWRDQLMHIKFATLNLKAGERSMEVSDFPSALNYLQYGISFLPETRWDTNYGLSLRLYESACLACYINGRSDKMTGFLKEILENASSFEDKLNGLFVLVQCLTSAGKLKESIGKIFFILDELGESFPESGVTPAAIQDALMSAKSSLDGYSKEDLISAPRLNNKRMHWALKLMAYALPYIFMLKPSHLALLACRIVNISTKYGVASESAFGLSSYAYCHISILHDIDEGYRWGKIAVSLLESFGAKKLVPKLKILCYHLNFFWVEPLQSTSIALLQCHREALMVGDNEYASFGAHFYCAQNILCGSSLPIVEKECTALALKMIQLKQIPSCLTHLTNHQSVLTLIGSNKNPFDVLEGFIDNEDELLHHSLSTGRLPLAETIDFNRFFVAFFFKRYEEAAKYAGKHMSRQVSLKLTCHTFYKGLTAFHFARQSADDELNKWFQIGEKSLSSFKTWATHSTWNWENKLLLLEAEWHFSKGEMEKAEEKYNLAIESARRHRFVHEQGLANELFSAFHISNGNIDKSKSHISEARACYEKWGAFALVELLDSSGK